MQFTVLLVAAVSAHLAAAQTLNIPTRVGSVVALSSPSTISGTVDLGNKEFDRGQPCNSDEDTGSSNAVFILKSGATLSNVIIGANALEGVQWVLLSTYVLEFWKFANETYVAVRELAL